ncbi:hypothetical protein ENBRE01_2167 [Enteropsectra breve]|nr:hypothetical protein ENBRE01_2167 [Enteropsectra breve]
MIYPLEQHDGILEQGLRKYSEEPHKEAVGEKPFNINTRFAEIIASMGYSEKEMETLKQKWSVNKKVQTIVSVQSNKEKRARIAEYMGELLQRHSLVTALFLKFTIEQTLSENAAETTDIFNKNSGMEMIEFSLGSKNRQFLSTVIEVLIMLKIKIDIAKLLKIYEHLDISIFSEYLLVADGIEALYLPEDTFFSAEDKNSGIRKSANTKETKYDSLFENINKLSISKYKKNNRHEHDSKKLCLCGTFLSRMVNDILALDSMGNEMMFLVQHKCPLHQLISFKMLEDSKKKFKNPQLYATLASTLIAYYRSIVGTTDVQDIPQTKSDNKTSADRKDNLCLIKQNNIENAAVDSLNEHIQKIENELQLKREAIYKLKQENNDGEAKLKASQKENQNALKEITVLKDANEELLKKLKQADEAKESARKSMAPESKDQQCGQKTLNNISSINSASTTSDAIKTDVQDKMNKNVQQMVVLSDTPHNAKTDSIKVENPKLDSTANNKSAPEVAAPAKSKLGGRFGNRAKAAPAFKSKFSEKKYKGIAWKKTNKAAGSIFSKTSYQDTEKSFSFDDFKNYEVTESALNKTVAKEASTKSSAASLPAQKFIWDDKKSYSLNIALGRIKLSHYELLDKINSKTINNDNLVDQLIKYFPTEEEFKNIKSNEVEGRAEKFFKNIENLQKVYSSLCLMKFLGKFKQRAYAEIIKELNTMYQGVLGSEELVKMFSCLLVIGNTLNINTFNGNAEGFSLESLENFKEKKILDLLKAKVNKEKMIAEMKLQNNKNSINLIMDEIKEIRSLFNDDFVDEENSAKFYELISAYDEMMKNFKNLQVYFNETGYELVEKIQDFISLI